MAPGVDLGTVAETETITHHILVPPDIAGEIIDLVAEGNYKVSDVIARVRDAAGREHELTLMQRWPVRTPRPFRRRDHSIAPLLTGQRVLDTFFPLLKGGKAAIPGPFGAGKTMLQQQVARWAAADIVIYVGCGERGNELVDILESFPQLTDPHSGRSLMERTLLVANTSNMPVVAREASIYVGVTIAEYYRDQGFDVVMVADSTSRWAEALREVGGRLGEMPVEEGYPAYLASRLSAFYERAGRVETLGCAARLGDPDRRGVTARRRLFRAGDQSYQGDRALLLGAVERSGRRAPLPGDFLVRVLFRLCADGGQVVGRAGQSQVGAAARLGAGAADPGGRAGAHRQPRRSRGPVARPALGAGERPADPRGRAAAERPRRGGQLRQPAEAVRVC